ncbi:MAG TPA: GNAT family N-acetyltransferase [Streptosporangiaceae bacterium]
MDIAIREASPDDAPALLDLQLALDAESSFMLLEPGERPTDPEPLRSRLARQAAPEDLSYTLVAEADGPAGYVDVSVPPYRRACRTGYLVMGVRASHAGRGVGRALLQAAVGRARAGDLRRLELTVMAHNRRALNLYLSTGFLVEGLRRAPLEVDGAAVDEYYMGLLL